MCHVTVLHHLYIEEMSIQGQGGKKPYIKNTFGWCPNLVSISINGNICFGVGLNWLCCVKMGKSCDWNSPLQQNQRRPPRKMTQKKWAMSQRNTIIYSSLSEKLIDSGGKPWSHTNHPEHDKVKTIWHFCPVNAWLTILNSVAEIKVNRYSL